MHAALVTVSRVQKEEHAKQMAHGAECPLNVQVRFRGTKLLLVSQLILMFVIPLVF